jgi:hypothetical protein
MKTCAHELGHSLGLGHGGHESTNCKPNYPSLMNYCGRQSPRFSKGLMSAVNAMQSREFEYTSVAPYPGAALCSDLYDAFPTRVNSSLRPGGCSYDYDGDGYIQLPGTAYVFPYSHGDSWIDDYDRGRERMFDIGYSGLSGVVKVDVSHDNLAAPSLAMGDNNYTYLAFLTDSGDIRVWHSTSDFTTCVPVDCWTKAKAHPASAKSALAPGLIALGGDEVLLVWHDAATHGRIRFSRLGPYNAGTNQRSVLTSGHIVGTDGLVSSKSDFVLARRHDDKPVLYFVTDTSNPCEETVYATTFDVAANTWSAPSAISDPVQGELKGCAVIASGTAPGVPFQQALLAVSVKTDVIAGLGQRYGIEVYDLLTGGGWSMVPDPQWRLDRRAIHPYMKRGGLQYSTVMERWVLMYVANDAYWEFLPGLPWGVVLTFEEPRWHLSGVQSLSWDQGSRYDNRWHDTRAGLALLGWQGYLGAPQGVSPGRIRYAGVYEPRDNTKTPPFVGKKNSLLQFRPFADDIKSTDLTDHADWPAIVTNVCKGLHAGAHLVHHDPTLCTGTQPVSAESALCLEMAATILGTAAENRSCTTDDDCVVVGAKADCSSCHATIDESSVGLVVNTRAAATLATLFVSYYTEGCGVSVPRCHEAPLMNRRCELGQCVATKGRCDFGGEDPAW